MYTETEQSDLLEKLKALGCEEDGLPSSVGGTWKYEEFTKWCRNKITDEMYFEDAYLPKDKPQKTGNMTVERKKQRTKCLNVIHSRQKRERRKAEQIKMEEDFEQLQKQNWALQSERKRLKSLLEQARKIIEPFESRAFSDPTSMVNSFEPTPSNAFSSTTQIQTNASPMPISDQQMQAMLMNAFAMQQRASHQSMGQSVVQTNGHVGVSFNQSMDQVGKRMNQMGVPISHQATNQGMNRPSINQHPFQHMIIAPQIGQRRSSESQHVPTNQGQGQITTGQYAGMNSAADRALMQAMAIPGHSTPQSRDANIQIPSLPNIQLTNLMTSHGPDIAPPVYSNSNVDPFAPLNAQIDSMVGDAPSRGIYSTNQVSSLRESVPQEFANFEIPEPDPLPETPSGVPAYQTRRRHFPM